MSSSLSIGKTIRSKVVGVTKRNEDGTNRQEILEMCSDGDELNLERDPYNEYDENAIEVWTDFGEQIGFLKKELASELARLMDDNYLISCVISEITGNPDIGQSYGCNIIITIGGKMDKQADILPNKSSEIIQTSSNKVLVSNYIPKKSKTIAYILWFFFGIFGAHRFYLGNIVMGCLMVLTLGGFGIWWFIDLFLIGRRVEKLNL